MPLRHRTPPRVRAPRRWNKPSVHQECTLHQLSPYIGKLKSTIARDLVSEYSREGSLIIDPFAGSGTIALEAALQGRRVFASDANPYAALLCRAKLNPPANLDLALRKAYRLHRLIDQDAQPNNVVPPWVRRFFHPRTLREVLAFSELCRTHREPFLFACLLGILHHQRPGFLSFPSSHLVPYLRNKRFPRSQHADLYRYRSLAPRLSAKIRRAFARVPTDVSHFDYTVVRGTVENTTFPSRVATIITSPPYMNALDYGRDNRLRLWFLDHRKSIRHLDRTRRKESFVKAIRAFGERLGALLEPRGYCILVVGDFVGRSFDAHPSRIVADVLASTRVRLDLRSVVVDTIPDIRRSRREYHGTKREEILIYRKRQ